MLRFTYLLLFSFSFFFSSIAQNSPIQVSTERNDNDEYVFYAENKTQKRYSVVVYFRTLEALTADTRLPAVKSIPPGKSRLFKLRPSGVGTPSFNWGWSYSPGSANPRLTDHIYTLPVSTGKQTKTIQLTSLRESYGDGEKTPDFYSIGFKMAEGDTIFTIRGGKVISITQNKKAKGENMTFTRVRNQLEIEHKDGSVATYSVFRQGTAMHEVGDEVLQGQPLALAEGEGYTAGFHVRLTVRYLKFNKEATAQSKDFFSWGYQTMKFKGADIEPKVLMSNIKYTGYIDDDLITQEMSKRQKKRYFKAKKSK